MYAEVIPLVRLPNNLHRFDYAVPASMTNLKPGFLVTIPWRSQELFGIVARVKPTTDVAKSKEIISVVHGTPLVPLWQLIFFEWFSGFYHFSEGSLALRSVLPLQKRKIAGLELRRLPKQTSRAGAPPLYFNYARRAQQRDYILALLKKRGTHLYCAAERFEAEQTAGWLAKADIPHLLYHSELSQKEVFDAWVAVRNGESRVVVGTKSALFLPFPALHTIVVDYETNQHHKNWDSQPYYHVRDVAEKLAAITSGRLYFMSHIPTLETYAALQTGAITKEKKSTVCSTKQTMIIPMDQERKKGNYSAFGEATLQFMEQHKDKPLFFFVNRRGYARALSCSDCETLVLCPSCAMPFVFYESTKTLQCHRCGTQQSMLISCARCHGSSFKQFGRGTEQIAKDLSALASTFNTSMPIIRLDSDQPSLRTQKLAWFVGTEYALSRIPWDKICGVIVVEADTLLAHPEYTAAEQAYSRLLSFIFLMQETNGTVLIQTQAGTSALFAALKQNSYQMFMDAELAARAELSYPPATFLVRLLAQGSAPHQIHTLKQSIEQKQLALSVEGPFGEKKDILLLRFQKNMVESNLPAVNALLPADWKVDPHPLTILNS